MADGVTKPDGFVSRNILIIFLAALAIRFVNAASIDDLVIYAFAEDSPIYWDGAQAWLESGFFSRGVAGGYLDETERVPMYNLFLLPFRWAFGGVLWPVIVAQSIVDSFTCVLIYLLGSELTRMTGLIAGLLAAGWPNLVIHSQLILGDSLFLFLFTGVLYFASKFLRNARLTDALAVGVLCGAAIMTRSIALFIPLSMAISGPFITRKVLGRWGPGAVAGVTILCASLIIVSPLLWRNVSNYGAFQLTAQGGTHFLNWIVGYVNSLERGTTFSEEARKVRSKLRAQNDTAHQEFDGTNPFEIAASQVAFAKQEFRKIPLQSVLSAWSYGAALNLGAPAIMMDPRIRAYNRNSLMDSTGSTLLKRLWAFFGNNHPTYLTWAAIGMVASIICSVLQFGGWLVLLRIAFWPAVFGGLAIAYFLLVNGPIGAPKYRLPFEPILIVFQALAIVALCKRFRGAQQRLVGSN